MPDSPRTVTVRLEPEGGAVAVEAKTVLQLLKRLERRSDDTLVIRQGGLLTPDARLAPGDEITLRRVTSTG